jgi:glycosyltransferase involved in cell wall biosynthesis
MNVCKIWDADYPWDVRVEKIVLAMVEAGHSVDLVCRNLGRRPQIEKTGKFTIRRLPTMPRMFGPIHTLWNFPFPFNPVWIAAIGRAIRESHADLILVRDLPLALAAAVLGKRYRIPVVFDMAENYPAMLEDRLRYTPTGLLGRLARHPGTARLIERCTLRLVDHTIVVVEESGDRLIQAGYPRERVSVVGNTPRVDQWDAGDRPWDHRPQNGRVNLVYLGNLDGMRGLDISIQAVSHLKKEGQDTALTVIGDGLSMDMLRKMANDCGVSDRVEFVGRLALNDERSMARVKTIMSQSHIGLIPHYATESCNTTIPNKLFDYMVMGLPVVVSDMKPTARIVRQEECGEVFKDRDVADFAGCVRALTDPEARVRKGRNGQEAIRRRYHWSHDAKTLVETLEKVAAHRRQNG